MLLVVTSLSDYEKIIPEKKKTLLVFFFIIGLYYTVSEDLQKPSAAVQS